MSNETTSEPTQPTSEPTAASTPEPAHYNRPSPYQTFATPAEIKRESDNRTALGLENAAIADVCEEWGLEVPLEFDSPAQGTIS
jgi:hypothetical protein